MSRFADEMDIKSQSSVLGLPRSVWALGFVSMLMDISSEMIHSLLPVSLVSGLGVSAAALGLLEGTAEGSSM